MEQRNNEELKKDIQALTALILKSRDTINKAKTKTDSLLLASEIMTANLNVGRWYMLCEQKYEADKSERIAQGMTAAAAESATKVTEPYYNFKRAKQLYDLGEEAIRIMKHAGNY